MPKAARRKQQARKTEQKSLLVVAHPDDETIFFAGLLLQSQGRKRAGHERDWKVICVTDANADGKGAEREKQFARALGLLGVRDFEIWGFPDVFDRRLDVASLTARLAALPAPKRVYTHSIVGEYGHFHHQDVSVSVHRAFARRAPVWSVAYNCRADAWVKLDAPAYAVKNKVLSEVYFSETSRFFNYLPSAAIEGYARVSLAEVEAIYAHLSEWNVEAEGGTRSGSGAEPAPRVLRHYRWLWPYLQARRTILMKRPF